MENCFQFPVAKEICGKNSVKKISSDEIRRGKNIMHQTLRRRKFHAVKFPAEKYNPPKILRGEIFCGGISRMETLLGEKPIFLVEILQNQ